MSQLTHTPYEIDRVKRLLTSYEAKLLRVDPKTVDLIKSDSLHLFDTTLTLISETRDLILAGIKKNIPRLNDDVVARIFTYANIYIFHLCKTPNSESGIIERISDNPLYWRQIGVRFARRNTANRRAFDKLLVRRLDWKTNLPKLVSLMSADPDAGEKILYSIYNTHIIEGGIVRNRVIETDDVKFVEFYVDILRQQDLLTFLRVNVDYVVECSSINLLKLTQNMCYEGNLHNLLVDRDTDNPLNMKLPLIEYILEDKSTGIAYLEKLTYRISIHKGVPDIQIIEKLVPLSPIIAKKIKTAIKYPGPGYDINESVAIFCRCLNIFPQLATSKPISWTAAYLPSIFSIVDMDRLTREQITTIWKNIPRPSTLKSSTVKISSGNILLNDGILSDTTLEMFIPRLEHDDIIKYFNTLHADKIRIPEIVSKKVGEIISLNTHNTLRVFRECKERYLSM